MLDNKKGVSGVIVTVLLILIAFAAIAVVWIVISAFIETELGDLGFDTVSLSIQEGSFKYNPTIDTFSLKVKREIGDGDMDGMRVYYTNEEGIKTIDKSAQIIPGQDVSFEISNPGKITKLEVVPLKFDEEAGDYLAPKKIYDSAEPTSVSIIGLTPTTNQQGSFTGIVDSSSWIKNNGVTFSARISNVNKDYHRYIGNVSSDSSVVNNKTIRILTTNDDPRRLLVNERKTSYVLTDSQYVVVRYKVDGIDVFVDGSKIGSTYSVPIGWSTSVFEKNHLIGDETNKIPVTDLKIYNSALSDMAIYYLSL